jgi:hypothetical protein
MKKGVSKITLSRETLQELDAKQVFGGDDTEATRTCLTHITCGVLMGD